MKNGLAGATSLLATEFVKRMTQLGLSRRQLTMMTGLSRQTLHNIEHGGKTDLKPHTYQAIDKALHWQPGTCLALANNDPSVLQYADELAYSEKQGAYRWRIVERIQRMSLDELERMVSLMERESLGIDEPLSTDDVIANVERTVIARIEARLAENDRLRTANGT